MGWNDHCSVIGCNSNRRLDDGISFYLFPRNKTRFRLWLNCLRRKDFKGSPYSKVCSKHFLTGTPSKSPNSVDYVPTLNLGYQTRDQSRPQRTSKTSAKTDYNVEKKCLHKGLTTELDKRKAAGAVAPDPCAFETVGQEYETCECLSVFVDLYLQLNVI